MSAMTLEQVRDWHRQREITFRRLGAPDTANEHQDAADAIDAHLAQPAQSVDVEKVREVISELSQRGNTGFNTNERARCNHWADKLTAALQEKSNG